MPAKQPARLLDERPWLAHYEKDVPFTVAIPRIPVQGLLESAVRRYPSRVALNFEGNRIPYRRLAQEVNRFAHTLLGLGAKKGERVILILPNCPQMVISFYGTLAAGGCSSLYHADYRPSRINPPDTRTLAQASW